MNAIRGSAESGKVYRKKHRIQVKLIKSYDPSSKSGYDACGNKGRVAKAKISLVSHEQDRLAPRAMMSNGLPRQKRVEDDVIVEGSHFGYFCAKGKTVKVQCLADVAFAVKCVKVIVNCRCRHVQNGEHEWKNVILRQCRRFIVCREVVWR